MNKLRKIFEDFMTKEGVLDAFKENMLNLSPIVEYYELFDFYGVSLPSTGIVGGAFSWEDSKEGYDFWAGISSKWVDFVKKRVLWII